MTPENRLRIFYGSAFAGFGVFNLYLPVFLQRGGMAASSIAQVFATRTLLHALVPPLWGLWADRRGDARVPLLVACCGSAVVLLPLLWVTAPAAVAAVLLLQSLCAGALVPLSDGMTLTVLKHAPERFGRIRLAASASYGGGLALFTVLLWWWRPDAGMQDAAAAAIPAVCGLSAVGAVVALSLPSVPRPRLASMSRLATALRARPFRFLLLVGGVHWASHAPYTVLLGMHLERLELGPTTAALSICVPIVVEVVVMHSGPTLLRSITPNRALSLTFAVGALRWLLCAYVTSPTMVVAVQVLHGVTFGLYYLVCVAAMEVAVPEEARSTGQGVFTAVVFGAGGITGTLLAGMVFERAGSVGMFLCSAALDLVVLGLMAVAPRLSVRVSAGAAGRSPAGLVE